MTGRIRLLALGVFLLSAAAPLLAAPIEVAGVVLDARGKGLAGATAELLPVMTSFATRLAALDGKAGPEPAATATTGADGRFRLQAPGEGFWTVRVRARGHAARQTELYPLLEPTELPELRMETGSAVKLRLVDAQGRPVAGARTVGQAGFSRSTPFRFDSWRDAGVDERTGPDGTVSLVHGNAPLEVTATAPGFLRAKLTIETGTPAPLRLESGCALTVEVLDREKKPVPGALAGGDGTPARTGADGRAQVTVPCRKDARIHAELADGRNAETTLPAKRVPSEPARLTLPAQPASLTGRVLDRVSRQPIGGALVWSAADPGRAVRAGRDGSYSLVVPTGDSLVLQAVDAGSFPTRVERAALTQGGPQAGPTLALEPAAFASGTVVDEAGRPVAGSTVSANVDAGFSFSTRGLIRTGAPGTFRLRLAPGQPHTLKAVHPSYTQGSLDLAGLDPRASRTGLRIVLKKGQSASGVVLDSQEKPVAGARLSLRAANRAAGPFAFPDPSSRDPEATSGADGRFTFEHLAPGKFDLQARAAGYGPVTIPGLEVADGPRPASLGTVILQPGQAITGVVVDGKDRPIAGAKVAAVPGRMPRMLSRPEDRMEAVTGADGRFALADLSAGQSLQVQVSAEGYAPRSLSAVDVPSEPLRVVLAPGSRLAGRVVDEQGKAVAEAAVRTGKSGASMMFGGRSMLMGEFAFTDESGEFDFRNLEAGTLTVGAEAQGYLQAERSGIELAAGSEVTGIELVLRKGAVVTGQVLGADGRPAAGAAVQLAEGDGPSLSMTQATADGDGQYRLEGVEPGQRAFAAEHKDFQRSVRDLEVRSGENRLDFRLGGGHPVAGRVVDTAGQPIAGADVTLAQADFSSPPQQARSGADGAFRLDNVGEGDYSLQASHTGYSSAQIQDLRIAGPMEGLEVRLGRGAAIRGKISGVDFPDLPKLQIVAFSQAQKAMQRGEADFRSEYRIDGVAPGEWEVMASLSDSGRQTQGKVTVEEGGEAVLDLDLSESGLTLSGRVTRRGGEPVADLRISVQSETQKASGSGLTNHEGAFRISGLKPGTYKLDAFSMRGTSYEQTVELTADQEIAIELPDWRVSGRVVDAADDSAVEGAVVSLEPADPSAATARPYMLRTGANSDSAGAFTLTEVPEGSFRLVARKDGYSPTEIALDIRAGAATENLRLALTATQGLILMPTASTGIPSTVSIALLDGTGKTVLTQSYPVADEGRARISEAPPGRWTLLVAGGASATASLEVTVPGPPVPVALPPATKLRVTVPDLAGSTALGKATVLGGNGQPYRWLRFGFLGPAESTVVDGQAVLDNLPPGAWRIVVTAPDGRTWQGTATTAPGAEAAVVLK
jgi:protocatechuate 3,4-dioxygenase beta subunit